MALWTVSSFADEGGGSCDEQIAASQAAGLRFIDIRNMDGFNISVLPTEQAEIIKPKLDAAGISVQMFGSPVGKIDVLDDIEIDLVKIRHMGKLAPILGCNAIRLFSYYNKQGLTHEEWQVTTIERLAKLRDTARELGLVLYHENERHIFGDLGKDVRVLGDALRDATFRMIFDFDNYNQSGEDVWETWILLRDQVDAIHLKDSIDGQHVPVGQGTGSVKKILRDAVARSWSGPLSIEPHLSHSGAVAATGPSGVENKAFGKMPPSESFRIACDAATAIFSELGAPVS
jgi:sugar phosphate isomerase/epimerase